MADTRDAWLHTWHAAIGKTIRAAVQHPTGEFGRDAQVALIFEDDTYMLLQAAPDGSEAAYVDIVSPWFYQNATRTIVDYLSPQELLESGMVNMGQYEHLLEQQEAREQAKKEAKRQRLLQEIARLESQP